jgi:Peptidase A4 family
MLAAHPSTSSRCADDKSDIRSPVGILSAMTEGAYMARHWWIPVAAVAVVAGGAVAVAAASASPGLVHHAVETAAVGAPIASANAVAPGHPMVASGGSSSAAAAGNSAIARATKSTNWSGYAVHSSKYRKISATWIVPAAKCPFPKAKQYAAFWVGLDGYNSNSVEQTGTDSDCSGHTPHYYGWYEMFPAAPFFFKTLVKPGNEMSASVTFSGTDTYTLVLKNLSRSWTHTIVKQETGLARTSAEVITEAPSSTSGVLPLADFGAVTFSSVKVSGIPIKKLNPTAIVMADSSGNAKDSTSAIANDKFHNTWIRRN